MGSELMQNLTMFDKYDDVVGVDDLCLMLNGISRKLAYRLLKKGEIQNIRIGREYKIPKINVIEYLLEKNNQPIEKEGYL